MRRDRRCAVVKVRNMCPHSGNSTSFRTLPMIGSDDGFGRQVSTTPVADKANGRGCLGECTFTSLSYQIDSEYEVHRRNRQLVPSPRINSSLDSPVTYAAERMCQCADDQSSESEPVSVKLSLAAVRDGYRQDPRSIDYTYESTRSDGACSPYPHSLLVVQLSVYRCSKSSMRKAGRRYSE